MDNKTQERIKADTAILPADILSEINDEAEKVAEYFSSTEDAWKAGAIYSELKHHNSNRAQVLVDALEVAKNHIHDLCMTIIRLGYTPFNPIGEINKSLEQWKGKEVKDENT